MGPKSFTACYVCLKEFGSKSIALHEPLCLKRWRASNKNLPADKRSSTPVKNADKNQNNPSWVCSHCQVKRSSHAGSSDGKTSSKRKSSSPKQVQSHCAKLVKSDCGDQCANSSSHKQVISDCTKLVKCGDESGCLKQVRSVCAKLVKSGDECKKSRLNCVKLIKCGDECTKSQLDCTKLVKCGNESCSSKQARSDCVKLVKCCDECTKSCSPKQVRSDCTTVVNKCDNKCTKYPLDCIKLVKCGDESSSIIIKHIHSCSVDMLKGLCSPKHQSKSNIPKQVSSSDCGHMTGVGKPEFSPKKGKENKNNNSNQIPPPSVVRNNTKNEAKSDPEPDPIAQPEDPIEISSTSRRSVRPQTKILRRPTPNLNHPVIQVDSDDSSGDSSSSSSDKSKDDNPKRLKMGEEETTQKPKNFIIYNKNNVDRKLKSKDQPRERNSATLQTAIPNPCNSCNRSLAPERLHSHAKKDSRGLMYRKSPTLDVKMSSPKKKQDDVTKPNNVIKVSKLPKAVPVTPDQDNKRTTDTLQVPDGEETPKSDISLEDTSAEEEKDLVDMAKACYICQKEFKVSSLLLHESKCLESWKKTNNSLTPNLRKLPPQRPDEEPPEDPVWTSVQSQLVPCTSCGRTFFPERLPVHRRVCKGKPSPRALKRTSSLREHSASSSDGDGPRQAAVYVSCYVCGSNYGSWVISMHEQQCIRRWRGENQKLPDEEKKEEPAKPERQEDEDVTSLVELGDNAWESHLQQLVPCPLCTRTFFPDRLGVHKRSCKGPSNGARRPKSNKGA